MKNLLLLIIVAAILVSCQNSGKQAKTEYVLAIHGGAGTITSEGLSAEEVAAYTKKLAEVLLYGDSLLKEGYRALDVVEQVVMRLEDCPLFNAGKGSVLTSKGWVEMDASIMDGYNHRAGAVSGVKTIKNPVAAARKVMDQTEHVMLTGIGAEEFASENGLQMMNPEYFFTDKTKNIPDKSVNTEVEKQGTVGAVALDKNGDLAAATSTGGMAGKMPGRVGDTPVIGAGTYADNSTCAVSATGHGEYFMRYLAAYDVAALRKYRGLNLNEAAHYVIHVKFVQLGARGGMIAIDRSGRVVMPFNTEGMFRGYIKSNGEMEVLMFKEGE